MDFIPERFDGKKMPGIYCRCDSALFEMMSNIKRRVAVSEFATLKIFAE